MWSLAIFFFIIIPPDIFGWDKYDLEFSLEYFRHRQVNNICFLTCEEELWTHNFIKQASKAHFRVSVVKNLGSLRSAKIDSCLRQGYSSVGVLINPSCPNFEQVMYYASSNSLLNSAHLWLLIHESDTVLNKNISLPKNNELLIGDTIKTVEKLNISVDADILLAIKQDCNEYELHEIYNFGKIQGGDLIIEKSISWTYEKGFSSNLNKYKYYRRWNFNQWAMRMISVVSPAPKLFDPKILTDRTPTLGVATLTKTTATILAVIAETHNLRFVHTIGDRWLDDFNQNHSKLVVSSSLFYKLQDITPAVRYISETHDKIDAAIPPVSSIEVRYYYRIPTYGTGKFENQFLRPLSVGTWISAVVVTTLCALLLRLSTHLERRSSSSQFAVFSVIATICQQCFEDNTVEDRKESVTTKLTLLVTGIFCVIIYNYYTSSVVSWLLNGPPSSINSLQELLDSPLELIFEDVGYTRSWLQTPTYYFNRRNADIENELRKKKVLNKKKGAPLLLSAEEGIKLVKAGGYAYHTNTDSANRLISKTFTQAELCELGSLQSMEVSPLYTCLQKNSPYKEFFVWSTMRLYERGIVKCIQMRNVSPSLKCAGSSPRALALGGASPAFLLLAGGYLLAVIILLAERTVWRYKCKPKASFQKRK